MEPGKIKEVFLAGIGGIGMSGLARYFKHTGCQVSGYDKTSTALTNQLISEGIPISFDDKEPAIPGSFGLPSESRLVIYTPAVPGDSVIVNTLKQRGFKLFKRSEVLGIISRSMFTIAVAGTHGKTTTSCYIAHILKHSGFDCSAFLGGIASNYGTNVLFGKNNVLVVEADEYDRSFLTLHPDIAIVTSMDADHLDIYGDKKHLEDSFRLFTGQLKPGGTLIRHENLPLEGGTEYAIGDMAAGKAMAKDVEIKNEAFYFTFDNGSVEIAGIRNGIPGRHNVENAVAAIQAALLLDVEPGKIKSAIEHFSGVKRRFEYIVNTEKHVYIDDYAHHPEELKACIGAVKSLYPAKKLTAIFQPHLFTRTRDFADEFGEVLGLVDDLLLLDIYPARELPVPGITSDFLLEKVCTAEKVRCGKQDALDLIGQKRPELLLTVGAGDIDTLVEPLKEILAHA